MPNLYILVGIPSSGKDTWAHERSDAIIHSSDSIRAELYGDESIQGDPNKVFSIMLKRTIQDLKDGKNVIYNATNVSRKSRKNILGAAKKVETIAVVFATPVEICKKRNRGRARKVPEEVFDKMLRRFELPVIEEGFDRIEVEYADYDRIAYRNSLIDKIIEFGDQKNSHHALSLYQHCLKCAKILPSELFWAGLFHDCGKIFTQKIGNDGEAHYYQHHNYSGYYGLCAGLQYGDAVLVNYHMLPYFDKKWKEKLKYHIEPIKRLHEADIAAH